MSGQPLPSPTIFVDGLRVGVTEPVDLLANSSGHRRPLARAFAWLAAEPGIGVVTGEPGVGKSSAMLSGFWSAPGSDERHSLDASINLQDGSLRRGHAPVAVVIARHPARAFDGLDPGVAPGRHLRPEIGSGSVVRAGPRTRR